MSTLIQQDRWLAQRLYKINQAHLLRERFLINAHPDGYLNFSSNDYLNLRTHPKVKQSAISALQKYGLGSGASALLAGYHDIHQEFEQAFAAFLGQEQALLFNSGYHANFGVFYTLADKHTIIIADKQCHASLLDGIQLSRAKHLRFAHQNPQHAKLLLKKHRHQRCLLVTESVFSMSGEISHLKILGDMSQKYKAHFIIDDAHGFGILGEGKSVMDKTIRPREISCLITPLGKALGSMGAMVSGDKILIESLLQFARTYRYTTALPPAIASGGLAALIVLQEEHWRLEKLRANIEFFISTARNRNLPLMHDDLTPIKSFLVKDNVLVKEIQRKLQTKGILVAAIRPPTVPIHTARIRISLQCAHNTSDIQFLLDELAHYLC